MMTTAFIALAALVAARAYHTHPREADMRVLACRYFLLGVVSTLAAAAAILRRPAPAVNEWSVLLLLIGLAALEWLVAGGRVGWRS